MASISTGGGHGGKKSVDQEVPLVPFIDLLLCCVMFLLVTAVWNQLARIEANMAVPGAPSEDTPPPDDSDQVKLYLKVLQTGYTLESSAGDSLPIPKNGDAYDVAGLRTKLQERHQMEPNRRDLILLAENGVKYSDIIQAMDIANGEHFTEVSIDDAANH
jgi:biopolymer transport protein ExbD